MKTIAREITRATFPVGKPVVVESIIDGGCGWEFDAPLHIVRPFHWYSVTGSVWTGAPEVKLEEIILDLSIHGSSIVADGNWWPYPDEKYLVGLFQRAKRGSARDGVWYLRTTVTVHDWTEPDYDCVTEMFLRGKRVRDRAA